MGQGTYCADKPIHIWETVCITFRFTDINSEQIIKWHILKLKQLIYYIFNNLKTNHFIIKCT
jgi:hypothetical protein